MAPTRALSRAIKHDQHVRAAELALGSRANRLFLLQWHDSNFWTRMSRNCYGRDQFLAAFCEKVDWDAVSASPLTIATAKAFAKKLNWSLVSRQTFLRQEFIYEMGDRLDMQIVSGNYNNLSLAVQQKYAAALDWGRIVPTHTMLLEWFQSPIADHIDFNLVAKHKHLNKLHINTPHVIEKIDLCTYMRDANKISDELILYCLREGRARELRAVAGAIKWTDHMNVFDEYPALADTLLDEWAVVPAWDAGSAPPAYYMRHNLPSAFSRDFVGTAYWDKYISYATVCTRRVSAAFALMVFDNFKCRVDWDRLRSTDRFVNVAVLGRRSAPLIALETMPNDERLWREYGKFVNEGDKEDCKHIIPMRMSVRDAYFKMQLVQPCASRHEHDKFRTCEHIIAMNGGEEAVLNWNMLSATQPVCPFNYNHLQNVNAQTYRRDNPHFEQGNYEKMIAAQMNIN